MKNLLHKKTIEAGYKFTYFDIIDSTNDVAFEIAQQLEKLPVEYKHWVLAKKQEQGRGRRGRTWQSPVGNLYTSLLLFNESKENIGVILNFIAGVSLIDTIKYFKKLYNISTLDFSLKWPNDVIINNKKLSGILLEVRKINSKHDIYILGIGVNIKTKVDVMAYETAYLQEFGFKCDAESFFEMLSLYWMNNYELFKNEGKAAIYKKWLTNNSFIGNNITVKTETDIIEGIFEGIDDNFNCLLRIKDNKLITLNTGDILLKLNLKTP